MATSSLVDLTKAEQLVDHYIQCWRKHRPNFSGIYEDNDFGCEKLQLIRNGFLLEDFNHDEISKLASLLTRELRGQINWDHKFFWSYCGFLTFHLREIDLFKDTNWQHAFASLVSLVLSGRKWDMWREGQFSDTDSLVTKFINSHLLEAELNKWQISGPLAFSVLEGLLRRKNKDYVNIDGRVTNNFSVLDASGNARNWVTGNMLNRLRFSLRCFEQVVVPNRGRPCTCLVETKTEFASLYTPPPHMDVYDLIDEWRNDLMHGNQYWMDRVPILLNLMCLFIIDEIDPALYNSKTGEIKKHIEWMQETRTQGPRPPWDLFPPDL
jgi:hypothetical protein